MTALFHIGDLVTVDEASEAVDAKSRCLPGDFVLNEEQDSEQGSGTPGLDDPMTAQETSIPSQSASVYEVVTYDLTSNTFRLRSKIGMETFRTVSHKNLIKVDGHLDKAANAALAEHYEHSPARLGGYEPVPVTQVDSEAELEAQRRTEIMSRHCAKIDPVSKDQAMAELKVKATIFHKIKRIFLLNPDWRAQIAGQDGRRPGEKRIDPEVDAIITAVLRLIAWDMALMTSKRWMRLSVGAATLVNVHPVARLSGDAGTSYQRENSLSQLMGLKPRKQSSVIIRPPPWKSSTQGEFMRLTIPR